MCYDSEATTDPVDEPASLLALSVLRSSRVNGAPLINWLAPHRLLTHGPLANRLLTNGPVTNGQVAHGLVTHRLPLTNRLLAHGPVTNRLLTNRPLTHRAVTHGLLTNGLLTHGPVTHGLVANGLLPNRLLSRRILTNGLATHRLLAHGFLAHWPPCGRLSVGSNGCGVPPRTGSNMLAGTRVSSTASLAIGHPLTAPSGILMGFRPDGALLVGILLPQIVPDDVRPGFSPPCHRALIVPTSCTSRTGFTSGQRVAMARLGMRRSLNLFHTGSRRGIFTDRLRTGSTATLGTVFCAIRVRPRIRVIHCIGAIPTLPGAVSPYIGIQAISFPQP